MYGEMKFPEFMFKPSQLTSNVSLHCESTTVAAAVGYTVLQRTVCVPCLPGTFFDPTTNNCTRCPMNTYQDQLAARSCTRCHRNHYTRHVGKQVFFTTTPCRWQTNELISADFYPNVTTSCSGLCYIANPSVVCLSATSAHPTQGLKNLSAIFFRHYVGYLSHPLTSVQNFTEIVPENPCVGGVKRNRGCRIERLWTYRRLYLINGARYRLGYN